jgi:hypothetical protein
MSSGVHISFDIDDKAMAELVDHVHLRIDTALEELTDEVEWVWRKIAAGSNKLNTTKDIYLDAIKVEREGDEIVMSLTNDLANQVESGSDPYDLKPGFLKGRTHRVIPLVEQGRPVKFRMISQKSEPWIHPGIHPRNIIDEVKAELENNIIDEVFSRVMARSSI